MCESAANGLDKQKNRKTCSNIKSSNLILGMFSWLHFSMPGTCMLKFFVTNNIIFDCDILIYVSGCVKLHKRISKYDMIFDFVSNLTF